MGKMGDYFREDGIADSNVDLGPRDSDTEELTGLEGMCPMFEEEQQLANTLFHLERSKGCAIKPGGAEDNMAARVTVKAASGDDSWEGFGFQFFKMSGS